MSSRQYFLYFTELHHCASWTIWNIVLHHFVQYRSFCVNWLNSDSVTVPIVMNKSSRTQKLMCCWSNFHSTKHVSMQHHKAQNDIVHCKCTKHVYQNGGPLRFSHTTLNDCYFILNSAPRWYSDHATIRLYSFASVHANLTKQMRGWE